MNPDSELEPDAFIKFENEKMGVWLPEGSSLEDLDVEWVMP